MAAKPDRARKLIVRTALATSSTIATLVGAQNLAMLDANRFQQEAALSPDEIAIAPTTTLTGAPGETGAIIQQAAPSIIILRTAGQAQSQSQSASSQSFSAPASRNILPPNPVELAAPPPQIVTQSVAVFQSAPQRTRSSR